MCLSLFFFILVFFVFDFSKKLGIMDYIYLSMGFDLGGFKGFNPKVAVFLFNFWN